MRPHSSTNVTLLSLLLATSAVAIACTEPAPNDTHAGAQPPSTTVDERAHEIIVVTRSPTGMRHVAATTGRLVTGVNDAAAATVAFFARHRELGLEHPESSLATRAVERDELGMTHVKLQQLARGIPIRGAEIAAHYANDGSLASLDAKIVDGLEGAIATPLLDGDAALAAARAHVEGLERAVPAASLHAEKAPALTFLPTGRLVYAMRIAADAPRIVRRWAFVDAMTGEAESYDDLHRTAVTARGYDGQMKTVQIDVGNNGYYVLRDKTRTPNGLHTVDVKNGTDVANNEYVKSKNGSPWDPVGVDAHANSALVWDYYDKAHGRRSYDGQSGDMLAVIHYDKDLDNAFNQGGGVVVYGDGESGVSRPNGIALDTVAHEITHGVTETSSGLVYQQQSGALNEAVSDIMGAAVEHHYRPAATKNWQHSEDAYIDGVPLRDFADPRASRPIDGPEYPRHMNEYVTLPLTIDQGGVHVNSLVIDHAAYLMTMGGVNAVSKITVSRGIGWEKMAKVWYRANTRYFLSTTNFVEAARGTLSAAKDLGLTADEQSTIECAWIATGVLEGTCKAPTPDPKPKSTPATTDEREEPDADDEAARAPAKKTSSGNGAAPTSSGCAVGAAPAHADGSRGLALLVLAGLGALLARRTPRRETRV